MDSSGPPGVFRRRAGDVVARRTGALDGVLRQGQSPIATKRFHRSRYGVYRHKVGDLRVTERRANPLHQDPPARRVDDRPPGDRDQALRSHPPPTQPTPTDQKPPAADSPKPPPP